MTKKTNDDSPRVKYAMQFYRVALERARDAVYWTPGLTLFDFMNNAIYREIARLEKKRKEPFARRKGPLRAGRPVGERK